MVNELPHAEYVNFHRDVDRLIEQVGSVADAGRAGDPLSALGLAAYVRARMADQFGELVGAARLAGASWEAIGRELGLSKQTAYNRFAGSDPTRWDGDMARCAAADSLPGDRDLCEGAMDAVRVMQSREIPSEEQKRAFGVFACVRHGAKLYAQIGVHARVYPNGEEHAVAPLEVHHRAQGIKAKAGGSVGS